MKIIKRLTNLELFYFPVKRLLNDLNLPGCYRNLSMCHQNVLILTFPSCVFQTSEMVLMITCTIEEMVVGFS